MRRHLAVILVAVIVVCGFAIGLMRPAKAAPAPVKAKGALVCLWAPVVNVGLC